MSAATYADKRTHAHTASKRAVSGDATVRQYGIDGRRTKRNLWREPGVNPRLATTGIRVGGIISTWYATGIVTRVGTVAGFYEVDGVETRWTVESVIAIHDSGVRA